MNVVKLCLCLTLSNFDKRNSSKSNRDNVHFGIPGYQPPGSKSLKLVQTKKHTVAIGKPKNSQNRVITLITGPRPLKL